MSAQCSSWTCSRLHSKTDEGLPCLWIAEPREEGLDGWALGAGRRDDEVVLLVLQRDEAEAGAPRDRVERDAPVGALLHHGGGDGVVRARLHGVAGRLRVAEQALDERARAAALIAVDHHARWVRHRRGDRLGGVAAIEARVATAKDDALQAPVAGNQLEAGCEEGPVVLAGLR